MTGPSLPVATIHHLAPLMPPGMDVRDQVLGPQPSFCQAVACP